MDLLPQLNEFREYDISNYVLKFLKSCGAPHDYVMPTIFNQGVINFILNFLDINIFASSRDGYDQRSHRDQNPAVPTPAAVHNSLRLETTSNIPRWIAPLLFSFMTDGGMRPPWRKT